MTDGLAADPRSELVALCLAAREDVLFETNPLTLIQCDVDAILANPGVVLRALGGEPYGHADYAVEGEVIDHDLWAFPTKEQG